MTNSESASQSQDIRADADQSIVRGVDMESKKAPPQEKRDAEDDGSPEIDAPPSASPPHTEIAQSVISNDLTDKTAVVEDDAGRDLMKEETRTETEEKIVQSGGDGAESKIQGTNEEDPLSPNQAPVRVLADNVEKHEPVVSKKPVQDPDLADFTYLPQESNVIDVDTFDDDEEDVSEDDAAPSPTADEFVSEAEDADDAKNIDMIEVLAPDSQDEAIDLTESPSTKPSERGKQGDIAGLRNNDKSAAGQAALIPERPIDIDEARESAEVTTVKVANIDSGTQDDMLSVQKDDGPPDEDTPDTDTVSADVNMDTNEDDMSPQQILREDDTALLQTKGALDIEYSADVAGHTERDGDYPMTATRSAVVPDDDTGRIDSKDKAQSEVKSADILDGDDRKIERETVQVESENTNADDGNSSIRILENKIVDDGSSVIALDETTQKAEEDDALSSANDELQAEESQDKSLHSQPTSGHFARYDNSSEPALRSNKTGETMPVAPIEKQSPVDLAIHEDHATSEVLGGFPKNQDDKEGEPVASVVKGSAATILPIPAESEREASAFAEETDRSKPGEPNAEGSAVVTESHGSVTYETASSTEQQLLSAGLEPQQSDEDKQTKLDSSRMDVDTGSAERKGDGDQNVAEGWKASSNVKASDKSVLPHLVSKDEGSGGEEKVSAHVDQSSKVSGLTAEVKESEVDHLPERSKGAGTGHQAPLFGIQLSKPVKTGPVSFSSPPTFPRYSLNPQAVPFIPSKRRKGGSPEKSKTTVEPIAATPDAVNQEKITGAEGQQEGTAAIEDKKALGRGAVVGDENIKTEGLSPKENTEVESLVRPSSVFPTRLVAPADDTTKEGAQVEREVESRRAPEPESFFKKATGKKVSFAPTPVKDAVPVQHPVKDHVMESIATTDKTTKVAEKGNNTSNRDGDSTLVESVSNEAARLGKAPTETDTVKEKQRIIQVQTDEGLRREVTNVTVAIRQDNSKMKLDRKKLTIQLTTGTEDTGKLQFFKGSGSSSKLYASLESKKDYLRVRKVTNRQFCMSVAKMAPPGDDAADIMEKYFVHFDERDIFEEMYSQSMANLQKQPKSIPHSTEPDGSKKATQTSREESQKNSKRQPTTKSGVKRSAESDNSAQASKKSKLLADKMKLLDKMAALRRKKEQKGVAPSKGRLGQAISTDSARSSVPSADAGTTKSTQLTDKKVQPKSENTERKTKESSLTLAKATHPTKRRTNEKASKEKVSKRARVPSSLSATKEVNVAAAPKSDAEPNMGQPASVNAYNPSKDGAQGDSTQAKANSSIQLKPSKALQSAAPKQPGARADIKLAVVDSDSPKHPDSEALGKVTKDFEQAQRERDALRQELATRNQSLLLEKAKTSQVQREHSEAWRRIKSIVEALGDDMSRLRRDETDRSLESLKRCEPSSSEDFFDRLHSFRPSTWAAFEDREIGALECALRGWHNNGPNTIRSSEGSEITLSPSYDDLDLRQDEVERVRSLLREGHSLLSGWIGQACPESFRTVEGSQRALSKEILKANTETLRGQGFDGGDFRFDWGANALLISDDVCERLAVYNWSVDGECLRCIWCNRKVTVHREGRFNASSKHYAFCPFRSESWKDSVLRNARTLGIEGDGDILMID